MENAEEQAAEMGARVDGNIHAVSAVARRRVLIIVENLPLPFDRRVWQEARTLHAAGYQVSIICPKGKGYEKSFEELDGVAIYRHSMPFEASGALGYLAEYSWALAPDSLFLLNISCPRVFDVTQGCNPPAMASMPRV